MSSWINYELDNQLVANPFLSPKQHGGKGFFLPSDTASSVLLGGSMCKNCPAYNIPKYPQLLYGSSLKEYNRKHYINPFTVPFGGGIRHRPLSYPPFHLPRRVMYWD